MPRRRLSESSEDSLLVGQTVRPGTPRPTAVREEEQVVDLLALPPSAQTHMGQGLDLTGGYGSEEDL